MTPLELARKKGWKKFINLLTKRQDIDANAKDKQ